jgi:acetyl-CoA decarbonylase/synthase complex subunit delta
MNILTSDMGLGLDKILIDTDMGGLGYGLDYGYSIMERIKLAAFEGDSMLNMPLIAFAGEEALKAKEAKSDTFSKGFGGFKQRSLMYEITTASAVIAAGANLIVLEHPQNIETLKEVLNG